MPRVSVIKDLPSGLGGSFRGIYFADSNSARINFDGGFALRQTFTMYSWIWPLNNGSTRTLFFKDRNVNGSINYNW